MQDYLQMGRKMGGQWKAGAVWRGDPGLRPPSAVVRGPQGGKEGCLLNNPLPTMKDHLLLCVAGDGGPLNRWHGKKQGTACGGVETAGKQWVQEGHWSAGAPNKHQLHPKTRRLSTGLCGVPNSPISEKLAQSKSRKAGNRVSQSADSSRLGLLFTSRDNCGCSKFTITSSTGISIGMDTDSNYMAVSGWLEDIVRSELWLEFKAKKKGLARDKWSGPTLGLFKVKCEGNWMIALCSTCYFTEQLEDRKQTFSTKGVLKKQNKITWQRFKAALEGSKDVATNRGFRMLGGHMITYEQQKFGLSIFHYKCWISQLVHVSRRKSGVWRDYLQFFAYEATLHANNTVQAHLVWSQLFQSWNIHRPDWICGSFQPTLELEIDKEH